MRNRMIIAIVLAVVALPFIFLGLIDPLEGGIALLIAIGLGIAVRLLSRVPFPKLTWISMVTSVAIGVTVLALAIVPDPVVTDQGVGRGPTWVVMIALLWVYRVSVVVTIAGAVLYLVRLVRAMRAPHGSPKVPATR